MNNIIITEADYEKTLVRLENLMDRNPIQGTPESEELDLVALLIQHYESQRFHFATPDPLEAIKFRMERQNLASRPRKA